MKRAAIAFLISAAFAAPATAGTAEGTAAYERGDFAAAHREFLPAARGGDARAQFSLGLLYLRGQGVERDDVVAMQWLRKAAGQGDGDAQLLLGELHMQDAPALRDLVKSHVWLSLALTELRGPKRAAALELRARVAARMTGEQIDRAKKTVREWQALGR
ncbi:MAG: hypothetical protein GEU92_13975 [Alphaproteobacteria bacterium]|nr:hypothetical protein [Alphaproteobacteria bacterium]